MEQNTAAAAPIRTGLSLSGTVSGSTDNRDATHGSSVIHINPVPAIGVASGRVEVLLDKSVGVLQPGKYNISISRAGDLDAKPGTVDATAAAPVRTANDAALLPSAGAQANAPIIPTKPSI